MKVTLCIICKNEAHVIERCLRSHFGVVDSFCIVDTGSEDLTQKVVCDTLQDKDFRLFERPWVNFGHNRSECLQLAREAFPQADYLLMNDADHVWHGELPQHMDADGYAVDYFYDGTRYPVNCIFKADLNWYYKGPLHEYAWCDKKPLRMVRFDKECWIRVFHEGARSRDPDTYKKDAALLEQAVKDEPDNPRHWFYLAQSYRDCGETAKAIHTYRKRAAMNGWPPETFYAKFMIGHLLERIGGKPEEISWAYIEAYNFRPQRAEAIGALAKFHRNRGEYSLACAYAEAAAYTALPTNDTLFIHYEVYEWQALEELVISAWYTNRRDLGKWAAEELVKRHIPLPHQPRVYANCGWYGVKPLDKQAA